MTDAAPTSTSADEPVLLVDVGPVSPAHDEQA